MIPLVLLNNKVLVKKIAKETTTASGFILPEDGNHEKIQKGEVVAVGNGSRNDKGERLPIDVKVGDRIMYEHSSYGTHEVEIDKETYYLISENDVIGILK